MNSKEGKFKGMCTKTHCIHGVKRQRQRISLSSITLTEIMEPRRQWDDKVQKEEGKKKKLPKMNSISGKTDLPK